MRDILVLGCGDHRELLRVGRRQRQMCINDSLLTINAGEMKRRGGKLRLSGNVTTLSLRDVDFLSQEVDGLQMVAPFEIKEMKIKYLQTLTATNVAGSTHDLYEARNYTIDSVGLLYTSPSPRYSTRARIQSSA